MKWTCVLPMILALAACGKATPTDTVESLVAHPDRLKEVQRLCQEDHAKMGDATCNAASEAFRRRFMGDGKGKYTPQPAPRN
ncbi:MAG: entry exclusion lipoprotein TrbK [Rhodanobacter sp.]|nr:MAG: entry exclusion lipoprotein TrbK [Rhodanobacter sp.]